MSRPIALAGDAIQCTNCPHCPFPPYVIPGIIATASGINFIVKGRPAALVGDLGMCGGPTILVSGAARFNILGRPVHRVTDVNSCLGVTIGPGDPTFLISD